jgi:copper homeostasis protein
MQKATSHKLLEVACFNPESCFIAEQAGADRIEFCRDYNSGGLTPLWDDILKVKERLRIPLHVIIRPRSGNFVYSREEIDIMKYSILFCEQHKVDGVVFGALTGNNEIDVHANEELMGLCTNLSVTFHRAVDACADTEKAMEEVIGLGFHRVLTSGGKHNAPEGIEQLKEYQKKFGEQITIMPGGGIRSGNIALIANETQCKEFHSAALTDSTGMANETEIKQLKEKLL